MGLRFGGEEFLLEFLTLRSLRFGLLLQVGHCAAQLLFVPCGIHRENQKRRDSSPQPPRDSGGTNTLLLDLTDRRCFCAYRLQQTPFQHVRGLSIWREVGELAHEPARFFQCFHTVVAAGGKVSLKLRTFRGVKRANRVGLDQLPEMFVSVHDVARNPSFKRSNPLRIQLFTVPNGSCNEAAISEWLRPSKYASSMAFFCAAG